MTPEELADARAKQRTALVSVAAAIVLVGAKLATGLITGSLAFVAEAAHSATDLVAALLTLFAVRVAVRPPDEEHHYGHGKAEHLAALGESAFLLLVSLFIGFESLRRLLGDGHGDARGRLVGVHRAGARDRARLLAGADEPPRRPAPLTRPRWPPTRSTSARTSPARSRC